MGDWLLIEMVYLHGHPSKYYPGNTWMGVSILKQCYLSFRLFSASVSLLLCNFYFNQF